MFCFGRLWIWIPILTDSLSTMGILTGHGSAKDGWGSETLTLGMSFNFELKPLLRIRICKQFVPCIQTQLRNAGPDPAS
jgi:hypothetical protein